MGNFNYENRFPPNPNGFIKYCGVKVSFKVNKTKDNEFSIRILIILSVVFYRVVRGTGAGERSRCGWGEPDPHPTVSYLIGNYLSHRIAWNCPYSY